MEVNATFDQIARLINEKNYTEFDPIPELQHLASEGNTIFTVIDKLGNRFTAEVYYIPETGELQPPLMQQIPYLIGLPLPLLHEIAVKMNLPDILRICRTNKYLNIRICENDNFWKQKLIHDFGIEDIKEEGKIITTPDYWKQRYQNFGKVWSFGDNENGQLGLGDSGDETIRDTPTLITGTPPVVSVSAGRSHSLLLDVKGGVWSFGENYFGQLGLGDSGDVTERDIPTLVTGVPPVVSVSTGNYHSLLIDVNGEVWSFGDNSSGELGHGDHGPGTGRNAPTLITGTPSVPSVVSVAAGDHHSLLLDVNGGVWSFGNNFFGQLGLGDHGRGTERYIPTMITGVPPVVFLSTGSHYSLLLDVEGKVWSLGNNDQGQLGLGDHGRGTERDIPTLITGIPPVKSITVGIYHSLLLDVNGGVWSFGNNEFGQLGLGDKGDGTDRDTPTLITDILPVMFISAGHYHSLLLDVNGGVWSFGGNYSGELGLGDHGDETERDIPTLITGVPPIVYISTGGHSLIISK